MPFDVPLARDQELIHGPKACHWWHHWRWAGRRSRGDRSTANGSTTIGSIALHTPKAPRQWIIKIFALGSCARSFAVRAPVRAPKEEQCFAIGQSLRTNSVLPKWTVKGKSQSPPPFPRREGRRRENAVATSCDPPAWRAAILAAQQQRAAHNVRRPVRFAFGSRRQSTCLISCRCWRPARCQRQPS